MYMCKSSAFFAADPAAIWAVIGGFDALADWHPGIATSHVRHEGGAFYRDLTTHDGIAVTERETARDDAKRSYSYTFAVCPLPIEDYHATLAVEPWGTGSLVTWEGSFKAGDQGPQFLDLIGQIYKSGLMTLHERFSR